MKIDIGQIYKNSKRDEDTQRHEVLIKTGEEFGELASAYLKNTESKIASRSAEDNILEEGADVLVCVLDLLFKSGFTHEEIGKELDFKTEIWSIKLDGREFNKEYSKSSVVEVMKAIRKKNQQRLPKDNQD